MMHRRFRMLFDNGFELSVVHLFEDALENDFPYEAYIINGPKDVLEYVEKTHPFTYPIADVMRYDSYGLASLVKDMQKLCGGIYQIYFRPEEMQVRSMNGEKL